MKMSTISSTLSQRSLIEETGEEFKGAERSKMTKVKRQSLHITPTDAHAAGLSEFTVIYGSTHSKHS